MGKTMSLKVVAKKCLMKIKHFRLYSKLPMTDTVKKITGLLASENVRFHVDQNSIKSTSIPLPIISIDKRMYTRKNWVGINPFIFASGIEVFITELKTKEIQVDVHVDQERAMLIYLFVLCITLLVAVAIPNLWMGTFFFVLIAVFTHLFVFEVCIKRLIISEILHEITER